jgi:hypothetical protein
MTAQPKEQDAGAPDATEGPASTAYLSGYSDGYRAALSVLDEAGAFLAAQRPSQGLAAAAARARRDTYAQPAKTAEQLRANAYASWGLTDPRTQQAHTTEATDAADSDEVGL